MPQERFTNSAESTLDTTVDADDTTVIVDSASPFPTAGQFRIRIDDEIMLVTAVSGANFTVTRAQEGTTGASHTAGATVRHLLTAGAIGWLGKVVAAGSTTSTIAAASATISLSGLGITQFPAKLMPFARVAERSDNTNAAAPGDIWAVMEVYFTRADGNASAVPENLFVRIRRLTGAASGYSLNIHWCIIELP